MSKTSTLAAVTAFYDGAYRRATGHNGCGPDPVTVELRKLLGTGAHVLDAGCGLGCSTLWLAGHGVRVTAADASEVAVARLTDFANHDDVGHLVTAVCQDLAQGLPAGTFDAIVTTRFLHHLSKAQIQKFLQKTRASTRNDGFHAITLYLANAVHVEDGHLHQFLPDNIGWLVELYEAGGWHVYIDWTWQDKFGLPMHSIIFRHRRA